jgi:hypothetical protein
MLLKIVYNVIKINFGTVSYWLVFIKVYAI